MKNPLTANTHTHTSVILHPVMGKWRAFQPESARASVACPIHTKKNIQNVGKNWINMGLKGAQVVCQRGTFDSFPDLHIYSRMQREKRKYYFNCKIIPAICVFVMVCVC